MKKILVAVDFSAQTASLISTAAELARGLGAHITVLYVEMPSPDVSGFAAGPEPLADAERRLQAWAAKLREEGVEADALLVSGWPGATIVPEAKKLEVDLIVVGPHSRGPLAKILLGSVSKDVLRTSPCPVLVVPDVGG